MLATVVAVALSLMIATRAETRSAAGLNRDLGNLRQFGQWTGSYAADFEDRMWGFTSAPNSQWPVLRPTGLPVQDSARQAIDIIRRRTGRHDFPLPSSWVPHVLYSHLVLADYADVALPDRRLVAAGDVHRMNWTDDPVNKHDQGFWQPFQNPSSGSVGALDKRWPYSSSYTLPPAWFDVGQSKLGSSTGRMSQGGHNSYTFPANVRLQAPEMSEVAFPSQKVLLHDYGDWYVASQSRYFAIPDASVSVLMADGAAALKRTSDANQGWHPNLPASPDPIQFLYNPRPWEPATSNGQASEIITGGYYRWTRGGLLGRDFGGSEIDTGQR